MINYLNTFPRYKNILIIYEDFYIIRKEMKDFGAFFDITEDAITPKDEIIFPYLRNNNIGPL